MVWRPELNTHIWITLVANARAEHAYRLRQEGLNLRQIGERFGVKKARAQAMVARGKKLAQRKTLTAGDFVEKNSQPQA